VAVDNRGELRVVLAIHQALGHKKILTDHKVVLACLAVAPAPQVVHAASPIPLSASGGIFDDHGVAAALMLGAVGVNLGTRFIASKEAPGSEQSRRSPGLPQTTAVSQPLPAGMDRTFGTQIGI
jgi:NAD(P)H-dependent flavin oxidoreductase YrpB (nitropropane dioxygenase family)